ncbi:lipoate-protein ligase A [Secundilactobacillus oryzae JCM 18671]|uniref:lipoate--protein ligase n=1 Tax=Secundilactobacillus oryzae JCM 18671 TaxID=1291743 RepID=A0A081BIU5_9LACO|nr:lipoate--protein ligase [Secundilactobacillus oryzae]GAK47963.1 lipoate-protein ligase A [Secundilactobacillus oryzae JCM 18671]
MIFYRMKSHDIGRNLATEQYLMNHLNLTEPLLLFYYQTPCIIVGHNQNTLEEVNQEYVAEHQIMVTRRLSGGGAVFDDLGNLSFSFVINNPDEFGDFKTFTQPIVDALHEMGATGVEVSGRNDLLVDGKKFSGNAMYTKNGKIFSHGTLMLDVDLDVVSHALNVPEDKIKSKGIKSVRSRVTNLKPYLDAEYQNIDVPEFRDTLLKKLYGVDDVAKIADKEYQLTKEDEAAIEDLVEKYYHNWDWVYGSSPEFTIKRRQHFDAGTIDARILVKSGKIQKITFFGDFFGTQDVEALEQQLVGVRYEETALTKALQLINTSNYFAGISKQQLIELLV